MSDSKLRISHNGLDIEVDVYRGTTSAGGPDPSSIENITVVGVESLSALSEWLSDQLIEDSTFTDKVWNEVDDCDI